MHILFLLNSDIRQEQRVNKEMATLRQAGHDVTLFYLPASPPEADTAGQLRPIHLWTRRLPKNLLFWMVKYAESVIRFALAGIWLKPHAVHCVDRLTLLPGMFIARILGVPYVYDTQEVWSEVNSVLNRPRRLWLAFERYAARRAFRVLVTDHFRLSLSSQILKLSPDRIAVLMNLPNRDLVSADCQRLLRADSGFADKTLLVYAGGIAPGRHIEECILALGHLPSTFALAIVGFGDSSYRSRLLKLACESGVSELVAMLPAVPWSSIPTYIRTADCAFAFYEKSSINNLYCSPSKLFDALLAGVPVVGTDNPLIVEVLTALDAGQTVSNVTPEAIARAVTTVVTRADSFPQRTRIAAMALDTYIWEKQESVLRDIYARQEGIR